MFIAQASESSNNGAFSLLLIVVIFGGLFLFSSLRQRRRVRERDAFLETLKVGDEIRSYGGVVGTVESLDDIHVVISTEGTRLRLVRAAVAARVEPE
ncbi:MAG: preprotein translocase subunit YajC [Acidimicrobiia bacterium]|nr:preprotein translocase subunit YajC [Acidimicrobiia bacterium]